MERGGNSVVARKRGGELTSRNVAARIGSKVETRVRLDCHPESILITATSQPLFLRRFYHRFSLFLDRERNSPLFELKSMAFREILVLLPPSKRTSTLPPPVVVVVVASFVHEKGGGEKFSRNSTFSKKTRPSFFRFLRESASGEREHRSTLLRPGCWTISSPLKLNSRSIRPLGRFCSNGSEINASFKSSSPVDRIGLLPSTFGRPGERSARVSNGSIIVLVRIRDSRV